MTTARQRIRTITLWFIAAVQTFLGVGLLFFPQMLGAIFGWAEAPAWSYWLLGMLSARFFAMAFAMILAARDPYRQRRWIDVMIAVQAIDWAGTLYFLFSGALTLAQVTTASFFPPLFIALLLATYPRAEEAAA